MKILQINNCHYRRGGADVVYLNTAELLSNAGNQVVCFSTASNENISTPDSKYFVDKIDFLNLSTTKKVLNTPRFLYSGDSKRKLSDLIKKEKPEVAHIHLYKGDLTASILSVLKLNSIPIVITLHDYSLLCPRNILLNGENKICEKCITGSPINCLINRCNRKKLSLSAVNTIEYVFNNYLFDPVDYFDKIIAPSKFLYEKHLLKTKLADRLVQLYNFSPVANQDVQNNSKGSYFLFYGRISQEKGLHTLIETWVKLPETFKLKIVGTGPQLNEISEIVRDKKLSHVEMEGFKSGVELETLIRNCSYVLVPSEVYENNPMTVIECYSFGKPAIVSNIGGLPEIVINGETGFTFKMADQDDFIEKLNEADSLSEEDYKSQSDRARAYAENNFSGKAHYEKLMKIYKDAILHHNKKGQ